MRIERLQAEARLAIQAQDYALDLRERGRLKWVADDPDCPDVMRLAALMEEVGEVARNLHDGENPHDELIQAAGVCLAWAAVCAEQ